MKNPPSCSLGTIAVNSDFQLEYFWRLLSHVPHLSWSCGQLSVWVEKQTPNLHHRAGKSHMAAQTQLLG